MDLAVTAEHTEPDLGDGRLRLAFRAGPDGRSFVARQYAGYPFHLGRAFYLDAQPPGMATVYIQSSSGGIFAGDRLDAEITADADAQAHITTQAPTIVHRTAPGRARQHVAIAAARGALVEYMPDPAILFPGASLASTIDVTVADDAAVVLRDSFLGHDPDGGGATFGALESTVRVSEPAGRLLALDRYAVTGAAFARRRLGVTGCHGVHGSFAVIDRRPGAEHLAEALRDALGGCGDAVYGGASTLPNGCGAWARITAADGAALSAAMHGLWVAARQHITAHPPERRRK